MKSLSMLIGVLCLFASHYAYAECYPGMMTEVKRSLLVERKGPKGKTEKLLAYTGTKVHVIGVKKDRIEVFVASTSIGNYVNAIGTVRKPNVNLACQL